MKFARAFGLLAVLVSAEAAARANGIATPVCLGCHSGGAVPNVSLTASPSTLSPGGTVTVTVSIQAVNGSTGGMYLRSNGVGTFSIISGQDTRLVSSSEVVHSTPRSASGGFVTFQVKWTAPATAGGVDLSVSGLSANGNGGSNGDNYGTATLSLVFGCAGTTYFRDMDGDGVGSSASGTTKNCAV
ncbi:MAG: choice-of-anchor V domain-containing protein, partial [Myxococcaceae bacterium]